MHGSRGDEVGVAVGYNATLGGAFNGNTGKFQKRVIISMTSFVSSILLADYI